MDTPKRCIICKSDIPKADGRGRPAKMCGKRDCRLEYLRRYAMNHRAPTFMRFVMEREPVAGTKTMREKLECGHVVVKPRVVDAAPPLRRRCPTCERRFHERRTARSM